MNVTVSLYKAKRATRGDPKRLVWILRWFGTDGKRYSKTIGVVGKMTKRQADAIQRDKQSKMDCGVIPVNQPRRMTLQEFIDEDLESIRADVRVTTHAEYTHAAEHLYKVVGRRMRPDRLSRSHVGKLKRYLQDLGRQPATIQKTVRALAAMFARAMEDGLVQRNPFAGQAKGRIQSKPKRIFQPHEIEAMVAVALSQWWRVFIKLAVTTGLRKSELLNLHWADIDFKAQELRVARKDTGTFKVRDVEYPILPWTAKTHQERTVPLPDDVVAMLQRFQLRSGGSVYVFLSLDRLQAIFIKQQAGERRPRAELVNNFTRDFRVIQHHAQHRLVTQSGANSEGVEWRLGTPHDLRRTYGTVMSRVVPIQVLCKWMGHSSVTTTQGFYLAVEERDADTGRAALGALYGGSSDAQVTPKAMLAQNPAIVETKNRVLGIMDANCPGSSGG